MMYIFGALAIVVSIMTMCISFLFEVTGVLPILGLTLSAFTFGFIMGENK